MSKYALCTHHFSDVVYFENYEDLVKAELALSVYERYNEQFLTDSVVVDEVEYSDLRARADKYDTMKDICKAVYKTWGVTWKTTELSIATLSLGHAKWITDKLEEIKQELLNMPEPLDCFDYFEIQDWRDKLLEKIENDIY